MLRFDTKRVLVVGGTSGIGEAIALGFAQAGADVIATGRERERVATITAKIKHLGVRSREIVCDATNPAMVRALLQELAADGQGLDVLVNAQGILVKGPAREVSDEDFAAVIHTNLESVFTVCREAYNLLKTSQGCIINIASLGSFIGLPHSSAYVASKGGVAQLTKVLAVEWAQDGIRCNAIAPGWIVTRLSEVGLSNAVFREAVLKRTPLGRLGQAEDIAGPALFLASDLARFITGCILPVDGGYLASI